MKKFKKLRLKYAEHQILLENFNFFTFDKSNLK